MKNIVVTTSWDDGHILDTRLAELLTRYGIKGTFYVAPRDKEILPKDRLTDEQILKLSEYFEIGAHTMTHPRLTITYDADARREIHDSKSYLENVIGKPVTSFCYPAGYFDERHVSMVRDAGFSIARTVGRFATEVKNPLTLATTAHAYRHWSDALPIMQHAGLVQFFRQYLNWDDLAISLFDKTERDGGVFHLWGHSWEIEKNADWARLERVLKHIGGRDGVSYATNGQLV